MRFRDAANATTYSYKDLVRDLDKEIESWQQERQKRKGKRAEDISDVVGDIADDFLEFLEMGAGIDLGNKGSKSSGAAPPRCATPAGAAPFYVCAFLGFLLSILFNSACLTTASLCISSVPTLAVLRACLLVWHKASPARVRNPPSFCDSGSVMHMQNPPYEGKLGRARTGPTQFAHGHSCHK